MRSGRIKVAIHHCTSHSRKPVTQSISCVAFLQKLLAIHIKWSEFFDLVAVAELSVVGVGYANVVESVVGLQTVIEAIRPGVAELEMVFDTL